MANYSIIIKNGTVFDGTGAMPVKEDIGIIDDKIGKIGNLSRDTAPIAIDASDKYVCPGFIDITTHSDTHWTLFSQPSQESFIRQGITTIIGGHGGLSLAPLVRPENIEIMQKWVDFSEININWQTMAEFLQELEERHPLGVNFGTLVGYGTVRHGIIGDEPRPAKNNEISQMQFLVENALKEGAFGISTNLGETNQKLSGNYEITALLVAAKKNKTLVSHHLEDEGKNILPALSRLISLSRNTGIHSHIAHFKAIGKTAWQYFPQGLNMLEEAEKENLEFTCDFFPYARTGSDLYMLLPDWAKEGGKDRILELIKGKERKNLIDYFKELTLHYEKITIASTLRDLGAVGKTIRQLSQNSGISDEETVLNLLEANNLQVAIFNEAVSEDNIEILAGKDYSVIASDGVGYDINRRSAADLPHPRSFGTFPRALNIFVKEKKILSWEKALRKMTRQPAEILGIGDRGIITKGAYADIVIFDQEKIADRANYAEPHQIPAGIDYVIINGIIALKENDLIAANKGRVLRHS